MKERKQKNKAVIVRVLISLVLITCCFICGCANIGPRISKEEIKKLEEDIELRATEILVRDWSRTWKVGFKIFDTLPEGALKRQAVIGALIVENSEDIARYFGLSTEEGCVVIGIIDDYVAGLAGLRPGDLIKKIDEKEIKKCKQIVFDVGETAEIIVERDGKEQEFNVNPEEMHYVKISVKEAGTINAYANLTGIQFTTGMVHFVNDDDELAVIMGHEIAHLSSKHIPKNMSIGALCGIASILTGPFAPLTYKAIYAPYGRNSEREADFLGLIYAHSAGYDIEKGVELWERFALEVPKSRSRSFLRSHPASTERILRVKKVMELLKSGKDLLGDLNHD